MASVNICKFMKKGFHGISQFQMFESGIAIELTFVTFLPIRLNLRGGHQTGFGIQVQRGGG